MKHQPPSLDDPPSIPFKEFRDGEIAGFFANESRTFHPAMSSAEEEFGRHRLVGMPHFSISRRATAAFRPAQGQDSRAQAAQTILLTEKLFSAPQNASAGSLVLRRDNQEDSDYPSVIMPFPKPADDTEAAAASADALPEDQRLTRIAQRWTLLPEPVKETITVLAGVAE